MHVEVELPGALSPIDLDRRLARGWFRSCSCLFRAPVLPVDDTLRDLVHVRLRLDVDPPSRSRRRLLKRNRERFTVRIGPAVVDDARRRLYELTQPRFVGAIARDLRLVALGELDAFDTREVSIWDGDRLVGVSFFDVGRRSLASILGLHDPAYARHSLGIHTMLEEMDWGRRRGFRHYYPGFVVPGLPGFDYKLRLGEVQVYDGRQRWRPRRNPPRGPGLTERATERVASLTSALQNRGLDVDRRLYPAFWLGILPELQHRRFLRAMWHLRCRPRGSRRQPVLVEHFVDEDRFVICRSRVAPDIDPLDGLETQPESLRGVEPRALSYRRVLGVHEDEEATADAALAAFG